MPRRWFTACQVVLESSSSTVAVITLDDHQREHLRPRTRPFALRDHLVLTAAALRQAFSFVPVFRAAQMELLHLVEMRADDVASRHHDRRVLATALVTLAEGAIPAAAIGAGGAGALGARVKLSH